MAGIKLDYNNDDLGGAGPSRANLLVWVPLVADHSDGHSLVHNGNPGLPPISRHHPAGFAAPNLPGPEAKEVAASHRYHSYRRRHALVLPDEDDRQDGARGRHHERDLCDFITDYP